MEPPAETERIKPYPAKLLKWGVLVFVIVYQVLLMWIWVTFQSLDWMLIRVSLSFADALAFAALYLSLWTYTQYEKTAYSADYAYLQDTIFNLRRHDVDPAHTAAMLAKFIKVAEKHSDKIERVLNLPDEEFDAIITGAQRRPIRVSAPELVEEEAAEE